jgi:hypothetical protein
VATLPPLAQVEDLADRLGRDLTDASEVRRAAAALDDASGMVRDESGRDWVDDPAPQPLVTVVLAAALRVLRNPEGYLSQTTGPFSVTRDRGELGVYLTETERALCRRYRPSGSGASGLWTQRVTRGDHCADTVFLRDQYGGDLIPYADGWPC